MEALTTRVRSVVDYCWEHFSAKVGSDLINVNKEASMQLHFAYVLKNSMDLIIHHKDESVIIELETGISINGKLRECDIVIKIEKDNTVFFIPIEMKCYKTKASTGKSRGATDLFRRDVYKDLELLESYESNSMLPGIQLTMTDSRNFVYPKKKEAKSWDYDISDGHKISNGIKLNTPIGGKPVALKLTKSYNFDWTNVGVFYFLKVEGI